MYGRSIGPAAASSASVLRRLLGGEGSRAPRGDRGARATFRMGARGLWPVRVGCRWARANGSGWGVGGGQQTAFLGEWTLHVKVCSRDRRPRSAKARPRALLRARRSTALLRVVEHSVPRLSSCRPVRPPTCMPTPVDYPSCSNSRATRRWLVQAWPVRALVAQRDSEATGAVAHLAGRKTAGPSCGGASGGAGRGGGASQRGARAAHEREAQRTKRSVRFGQWVRESEVGRQNLAQPFVRGWAALKD